jgi:ADP-ribosylglycohydrolase
MLGAIAGDVIGSVFEHHPLKSKNFPLFSTHSRFTDDTVLTAATAFAILTEMDYGQAYKQFARMYPWAGYGATFFQWMQSESSAPYNSWGNGSAMRVSPVGFAFDSMDEVLNQARKSAAVTHNHPEGIKGAQATALAVFLARTGNNKKIIRREIEQRFGYDLNRSLERIRPAYGFNASCQGSVPEALICFSESTDYEDAVRNAVSLGGDSDTLACIAGGVAQAYYRKIPQSIEYGVKTLLPEKLLDILARFESRFMQP